MLWASELSRTNQSKVRRMRSMHRVGIACVIAALFGVASPTFAANLPSATTQPEAGAAQPMWVNHIEPILSKSCFKCHGGEKQKGGLDLRSMQTILSGGTDGSVITPGRPGESPIYQRLQPGVDGHMPPEKAPQLNADEISLIQEWVATLSVPTAHLSSKAAAFDTQTAPSLIEMATRVKWEAPAGMLGSDVIDHLIQDHWQQQHVSGNQVCDDRTFVRRIYLDLAGRIPTRDEADTFINSTDSQKRAALVDQLLAGKDYPQHMADVLDVVLMERKGKEAEYSRKSNGWIDYLKTSMASNRPWNEMVAEMITARPKSPSEHGAVWFLYERKNNYQSMAEAVAPMAFGVSVACAQCHNHPMAHEIKQQQYWGLVAAFNRTSNVDSNDGPALSESAIGGFVNFTNLKKESQPAILAFPNDRTVAEERPADGANEKDSPANYVIPPKGKSAAKSYAVPKFSRRQSITDAVTHDNPLLARAFVNRTWAMLLGRGFVNPVDEMDSRHQPSHPELLAWLSNDFEKSGYDIKRLIRTIVLSKTYQLDSQWKDSTAPLPELFAKGLEKPLSAEVLYRSLLVATRHDEKGDDTEKLRQSLITAYPTLFDVEYNATLQQSMFLTNSPLFESILKPSGQNLTARLNKLGSNEERVRTAFVEILGREPDDAEKVGAIAYLDARNDRLDAGVRQMTWALLTSAEFLLNH